MFEVFHNGNSVSTSFKTKEEALYEIKHLKRFIGYDVDLYVKEVKKDTLSQPASKR